MPLNQKLNRVIDVVINVSPQAAGYANFDEFLIIGRESVIPNSERLRLYNSIESMIDDGFTDTDPAYIAAQLYVGSIENHFGVGAAYNLWIGLQDLTAIQEANIAAADKGVDYVVGDILTVVQGTASGGQVRVATIGDGGTVETISIYKRGTGYSVLADNTTTGGSGTGAKVDISEVGETPAQAITACRVEGDTWYGCMIAEAPDDSPAVVLTKQEHLDCAAYCEAASPASFYAYTTQDEDVLNGVAYNLGATLKGLLRNRAIGMYSTSQDGNNDQYPYAIASIMAYAMGANTGLNNSAYTLKFKTCPGILVEPLTSTEINNIEDANVNIYSNYANQFNWFEQGVMASGWFFDRLINLDMLGNRIQINIANLLSSTPKIPLTDPGVTMLILAVEQACEQMKKIGYIAPSGVWSGLDLLNLKTGQAMPKGYIVQAESVNLQAMADRIERKSPPIYVCLIEAGAVHSVTIQVNVQS